MVETREQHRGRDPEADLLALQRGARGQRRRTVRVRLGPPRDGEQPAPQHAHHGEQDVALPGVAHHDPERPGEADRDHQQQEDLHQVRERVRVLERVRGVGVEDPAAVRAQLLDRLLRRRPGASAIVDEPPSTPVTSTPACRLIVTPQRHEHDRGHEGDRQQHAGDPADQVDPEVADPVGRGADETADQRHRDRHADRRGDEVLHGQPGHLHEVAHDGLRHVRLPVRVGHERDRGVERDPGVDRAPVEAQRQQRLQALQQVEQHDREEREGQQRGRVAGPALLGVRVDPDQPVDRPLDPPVPPVGVHGGQVVAERHVHRGEEQQEDAELDEPGHRG